MRLIILAGTLVLMACPTESVTREDIGLSEAGPMLDVGRVDAGRSGVDAALADRGTAPADAGLPGDAAAGTKACPLRTRACVMPRLGPMR